MECGLVRIKQQGRERFCEARLQKNLAEVSEWVELYRKLWTQNLDDLENFLETDKKKISKLSKKTKK